MADTLSRNDVLRCLTAALNILRVRVDSEAPIQRLLTLLAVAQNPDIPQYDVLKIVKDVSEATISRNVADLTTLTRRREPGPGLVEQRPDPMYRRRNLLRLTGLGERVMQEITDEINGTIGRVHKTKM